MGGEAQNSFGNQMACGLRSQFSRESPGGDDVCSGDPGNRGQIDLQAICSAELCFLLRQDHGGDCVENDPVVGEPRCDTVQRDSVITQSAGNSGIRFLPGGDCDLCAQTAQKFCQALGDPAPACDKNRRIPQNDIGVIGSYLQGAFGGNGGVFCKI